MNKFTANIADIPVLDSALAAQFDRECLTGESILLILRFPPGSTRFPGEILLLLSLAGTLHDGDPVAAATKNGKAFPAIYHCYPGNFSTLETAENKLLMKWQTGSAKKYFRWIFPVLQMKICCPQNNKKTAHSLSANK